MSQEYTTRFGRATRVLLPYGAGDPLTGESSPGSETLNGSESSNNEAALSEGSGSVNTEQGTRVQTDVGPPPQIGSEAGSAHAERSAADLAEDGVIETLLNTHGQSFNGSEQGRDRMASGTATIVGKGSDKEGSNSPLNFPNLPEEASDQGRDDSLWQNTEGEGDPGSTTNPGQGPTSASRPAREGI
jgi:hypothetical protein